MPQLIDPELQPDRRAAVQAQRRGRRVRPRRQPAARDERTRRRQPRSAGVDRARARSLGRRTGRAAAQLDAGRERARARTRPEDVTIADGLYLSTSPDLLRRLLEPEPAAARAADRRLLRLGPGPARGGARRVGLAAERRRSRSDLQHAGRSRCGKRPSADWAPTPRRCRCRAAFTKPATKTRKKNSHEHTKSRKPEWFFVSSCLSWLVSIFGR